MAEQVLKFSIRTDGAQARAEAEATARAIVAAVRGAVSSASAAAGRAAAPSTVSGASGGSVGGDVRAALAAARLEQAQSRVAVGAQNVAAAQTRADAATLRAATSYQKAADAAQKFAGRQLSLEQILGRVGGSLRNLGLGLTSLGASLSIAVTAPLFALGAASFKAAKDIDASVNTLRAFTGSAEAAEKRLASLIATAQKTPGLTSGLAAQLDAQLRVAQVTEATIDRILPAIGRLNAVKPIDDPDRFVQNLVQLVTQNFERADLKELVGRSPLAGQLITQIFNVDSPTNAAAIRKSARAMGIRTVDDFFAAFADAAARNKGLAGVTESLGTRFQKLADRLALALRPLGLALADSLGSIADVLLPVVEGLGKAFGALPRPVQTAVIAVVAFAAVLGPTLFVMGQFATGIGGLISAFGRLYALGLIPSIEGFRLLRGVMVGTTSLAAGQAATTAVAVGGWAAFTGAITAAVGASLAINHAINSYLESLKQAHPWIAKVGQAIVQSTPQGFLLKLARDLGLIGGETQKVAEAQAGMVAPTARATSEVDKQVESLRQLKMALKEAELAAKSRAAAARRDFEEQKTNSEELTRALVANVEERLRVELAEIDEAVKARKEAFDAMNVGPVTGDPEEMKKVAEELTDLAFRRQKVVREAYDEVADLQSAQRVKEREDTARHAEALLSIARTHAERQIDVLRDAADQNESLRLDSERKIVTIERRLTDAEIAEARRRLGAAAQGTEARTQLEDELNQKLAERGRQRAEQARRVAKAELDAALLPVRREGLKEGARDAGDGGAVARLRDAAERRVVTIAQAETAIGKIVDDAFARRIQNLKSEIATRVKHNQDVGEQNARLAELEQRRANESEEADRRVREGREQDLENAREHFDKLLPLQHAVREAQLAARQAVLDATRVTFGNERELIIRRHEIERDRARLALDQTLSDLNDREHAELLHARKTIGNDIEFHKRRLEIQRQFDELRKAARVATDAEIEAMQRGVLWEDPFKPLKDRWTDFKEHVANAGASIQSSVGSVAAQLSESFGAMEDALRSGIAANILYGESLGQALKKALATQLANLSAELFIQGTKHAAYAIGSLAFGDFGGAAKHAAASAAFFAGAALAGKIGGSLAQSAGMRGGGVAAGSVAAQDAQPRNQTFNYGGSFSTPASEEQAGGSRGRGVMGGALAPILNRLESTLARIEGIPPGQVVSMGAGDAHEAIGVAVLRQSGSNDGFNDSLARNMRVA